MATVQIDNGREGERRPVVRGFNGERWAIARLDPDPKHPSRSWTLTHKNTGLAVATAWTAKELASLKLAFPLLEEQGDLWDYAERGRGAVQPMALGDAWKAVRVRVWGF